MKLVVLKTMQRRLKQLMIMIMMMMMMMFFNTQFRIKMNYNVIGDIENRKNTKIYTFFKLITGI